MATYNDPTVTYSDAGTTYNGVIGLIISVADYIGISDIAGILPRVGSIKPRIIKFAKLITPKLFK